jgi:E3 ubiquitin-protein ligase SHPRH
MTAEMKNELRPFVSQSTLLVIPSSLVHQWYSEINKHLKLDEEEDKIGYVLRYKRDITIPWTANDDRQAIREQARARFTGEDQPRIVLATYEDLSKELHISKRSKKAISPLLDIHWWRVMLDEAQLVSTSNGSAAEMVNCLWRTNGWIVTSTPFNSSIRDMHGLLTFLDSDFASKKLFEEIIALPFLAGDIVGVERAHGLLKRIMWRHRKEHVESELGLPPSSMQTLLLEKKGLEKTLYDREHKAMLAMVKSAVGVGRSLTKKQQDILLSLRKLISHPQLAANLGYGGPGAQRSTFANLFADLIFRNQGELYNVQMEYIVLILKIAAGKKFRKEEKDEETWKGGMSKITGLQEKLLRAREYARQAEARDIVSHKVAVTKKTVQETEEPPQEGEKKGSEEQQQQSSEKALETQTESEEKAEDGAKAETGKEDTGKAAAPITMRYDEALYWIDVLLHPKADMTDTSVIFDPERLTNFFFEKRIIEANSVDVDDPRYHAIELDAGDEEEESKGEAGVVLSSTTKAPSAVQGCARGGRSDSEARRRGSLPRKSYSGRAGRRTSETGTQGRLRRFTSKPWRQGWREGQYMPTVL